MRADFKLRCFLLYLVVGEAVGSDFRKEEVLEIGAGFLGNVTFALHQNEEYSCFYYNTSSTAVVIHFPYKSL